MVEEEARKINRLIHLKYVTPDALDNPTVVSYLSKGDDVTVKVHMDHLITVSSPKEAHSPLLSYHTS